MRRCSSTNVGDIGEAKALFEFAKLEIPTALPTSNNLPYDLIIDCLGNLFKVQVKTRSKLENNKFHLGLCQNNAFTGQHWEYDDSDVDLFFIYCIEIDCCCLLLKQDIQGKSISLRLDGDIPKNNQSFGIKYIGDYSIEKTLYRLGYKIS